MTASRESFREAWRLAWPLILSNISVPLLGIVDSAVVGHLSEPHYLGAVALGAATFSAVYLVIFSLRMSTTALAAQAFGAGDGAEVRASLIRPMAIALVLGILFILLGPAIATGAAFVFAPSEAVGPELDLYITIRILGAPAAIGQAVVLGWLLGCQNARASLIVLLVTNGTNILLDLWFVFGLGYKTGGVAAATVIANYLGLAIALLIVSGTWRRLTGRWRPEILMDKRAFARLIAVNRDLFIRTIFLEISFALFAALSSRQGELILAANAILENFLLLAAYALDGFAFASEAMVGRQVGARNRRGVGQAVRACALWSLAFATVIALFYALAGTAMIRLITSITVVQDTAATYLPYLIVAPLIGIWAYLFDGVFAGATQTRELRDGTIVATALFVLAAFTLPSWLGNHGLWLALGLFLAARGGWFAWRYRRLQATERFMSGERVTEAAA
ncbi:MAG: MATE family efflux transporter [Geminicoccaceae bacterium]